jgi:hypothetical protein
VSLHDGTSVAGCTLSGKGGTSCIDPRGIAASRYGASGTVVLVRLVALSGRHLDEWYGKSKRRHSIDKGAVVKKVKRLFDRQWCCYQESEEELMGQRLQIFISEGHGIPSPKPSHRTSSGIFYGHGMPAFTWKLGKRLIFAFVIHVKLLKMAIGRRTWADVRVA